MYDLAKTANPPEDLGTRQAFSGVRLALGRLAEAAEIAQTPLSGRRFTDCVIHGPAILVPGPDTRFHRCNMGDTFGDTRNLFLRAAGPLIVGGLFMPGCMFEGCLFVGVGFAGDDAFVEAFVANLTPKA
ncbi:hypothetical protein BZG35_02600 [Brevundimonas sp. LM2]|uniref:hypothetical protein n=1 Tax=Brevundimonas sp. LM2 TaxID=1938605 RepID=UPI000983A1CB|nr:hypothetical protein [Brevundimonas sp. LM2]AQR60661.1 hypothetical protein BZG35_02600 [Brevundimonas sp. LM2]